ncbi:MAG: hypothetical protein HY204_03590 [Nitrospirae bacterium]|nr:hypothetical protein [Nitrospirota bacterium]
MVLKKSSYGSVFRSGEPLPTNYQGSSTCGNCGSVYDWRDVYSGRYDPEEKVRAAGKSTDPPKKISVVAYLLGAGAAGPPPEERKYVEHILKTKYPSSQLHKEYLIGWRAKYMTETEALVLYNDYVRTGDLPNLGEQIDSSIGKGPDGTDVVVLYFKP